jgi:hypothetical protein
VPLRPCPSGKLTLAPATWKDWYDAYRAKRTALEPVADDLIALTHLAISAELADRVGALREEFDRWGASYDLAKNYPDMPQAQQEKELEDAIKTIPEKIKGMLDEVTREYRRALEPRLFRF